MDVTIIVVGITNEIDEDELLSIVSQPASKNYHKVDTFGSLNKVAEAVIDAACE